MDDFGSFGGGSGGGGSKEFGRSEAHAISSGSVNFGDGSGRLDPTTLIALAGLGAVLLMLFAALLARR